MDRKRRPFWSTLVEMTRKNVMALGFATKSLGSMPQLCQLMVTGRVASVVRTSLQRSKNRLGVMEEGRGERGEGEVQF